MVCPNTGHIECSLKNSYEYVVTHKIQFRKCFKKMFYLRKIEKKITVGMLERILWFRSSRILSFMEFSYLISIKVPYNIILTRKMRLTRISEFIFGSTLLTSHHFHFKTTNECTLILRFELKLQDNFSCRYI